MIECSASTFRATYASTTNRPARPSRNQRESWFQSFKPFKPFKSLMERRSESDNRKNANSAKKEPLPRPRFGGEFERGGKWQLEVCDEAL